MSAVLDMLLAIAVWTVVISAAGSTAIATITGIVWLRDEILPARRWDRWARSHGIDPSRVYDREAIR